jgi:hypothetical protein
MGRLFRRSSFLALGSVAFVAALLVSTLSTAARASDEVDVRVEHGQLIVVVKGAWHINADYPWKLLVGEAKLDRSHFAFDEKTARLDAPPSGKGSLRGAVCAGGKCKSFTEEVVIP